MDNVMMYMKNHWILIPLGIVILASIAMLLRKDRGQFLFKKHTDLRPEEKKAYYFFHTLKYIVLIMVIVNFLIKFKRGDYY